MLGINKIDWYISKKFILTFFAAIALIIIIVIIFDVSEKIDNFVKNEAPLREIIFDYYVNFIPYFMNMFSPLFVFITVIFFTSQMAANSEIIAILSGGVSYARMLVPYIASAALIGLLSLGLNLYVVPRSNATRIAFEQKYVKKGSGQNLRNIHYQIAPGQFVYIESFSKWNNTAYRMTVEDVEGHTIKRKVSTETAVWDSTMAGWKMNKVFTRTYEEGSIEDNVTYVEKLDTVLNLTISDLYNNKKTVETLPAGRLSKLIEVQKSRGDANVMYSELEQQRRYSMPFAAIILTVMGVCLSSRKKRGGIGWNIGIGIALAFSYILFLRFSEMFVYTNTLSPGVALWIPNVLYSLIAIGLYKYAPK